MTIPANTAKADAVTQDVALSPGRLVEVEIVFPRGCVQLVHTVVRRGSHQLYPLNPDGDIAGEGGGVRFRDDLILEDDPYILELVGWSDDDTYPHTLTYRFNLIPIATVTQERLTSELQQAAQRRALAPRPSPA